MHPHGRNRVRRFSGHHIETGIWIIAAASIWLISWFVGRHEPITLVVAAVLLIVGMRHFLLARKKRATDEVEV